MILTQKITGFTSSLTAENELNDISKRCHCGEKRFAMKTKKLASGTSMGKRLALIFTALLMVSVTAGCSGPSPTDKTSSKAAVSSKDTTASVDGDRELNGNLYKSGLPIVKDKESFSLLIDTGEDPSQMELFKRFEQETNVEVKWMAYPYDVASEKKNLMYTSGEYPDAVGGWLLASSDIMKYGVKEQIYIPIEDLVSGYAPRIADCFDNFPDARPTLTTPDGHIYTVPLIAQQPLTSNVAIINTAWLKKLGLEMPKTTDDLYIALKAFKEKDPNGNGKADEIPLSTEAKNIGSMFGWFGYPDPQEAKEHIAIENGKPIFVPTTQNFKEAIMYFSKLFQEKLIDQESFTHSNSQYAAKGKEDVSIYGVFQDWSGPSVTGQERYDAEYAPLPVLSSPNCKTPQWNQGDPSIFKTQFAITKAAKNPEMIIRWLDYCYDEDNSVQIMRGPYGNLLDRKDDKSFFVVDPPEGETMDSYRGKISVTCLPYCVMPAINDMLPLSEFEQIKKDADNVYAPGMVRERIPASWMLPEESESISTIQTDIDKYVADMVAAWISGQSDINKDWDAFNSQLKVLGLDTYMKVKTTVITRTLSIK